MRDGRDGRDGRDVREGVGCETGCVGDVCLRERDARGGQLT